MIKPLLEIYILHVFNQKCQILGSNENSRLSMTSDSRASLQKYVLDKQWFQIIQKTVIRAARPLLPIQVASYHSIRPYCPNYGTRFAVDQETQKLFIWFWISGSDFRISNFGIFLKMNSSWDLTTKTYVKTYCPKTGLNRVEPRQDDHDVRGMLIKSWININ